MDHNSHPSRKGRHAIRHHTKGRHTKHKLSTRGSLRRRSKSGGNVDYKFSGLLLQSKKLVQNTGFGF